MISMRRLPFVLLALVFAAAPTAFADVYYAYSQGGIAPTSDIFSWGSLGGADFVGIDTCDTPEGGTSLRWRDPSWGGFGFFHLAPNLLRDLSAFEDGELRFFLKTPENFNFERADVSVTIKCDPGTGSADQLLDLNMDGTSDALSAAYGYEPLDNDWQEISIPICDFFGGTCDATSTQCLQNVESPLVFNLRTPATSLVAVWADYVRWVTPNNHSGATTVETSGRELLVNGKPFAVNGMAYQPLSVGENWQAAWRDRPDRYEVDFPKIAASGANTVRLYAPILTTNMLDKAWEAGLFVIPTFGVDDFQLSCPQGRAFMQARFEEFVADWGDHPAILMWLVGNEVGSYLSVSDLYADFFPQLNALAAAIEGTDSHPVGSAMRDVGDTCVPGVSDDPALPNVDFWGTQLYRGCTFGNAFTQYAGKANCAKPLVVTEFGADSWKSMSSCSVTTATSCYVNTDCPQGTCSVTTTTACNLDTDCPGGETCNGGEFCDGAGMVDEAMQASCLDALLNEADAELAIRTAGGVSSGQVVFEWADEWWKAACLPTGGWEFHDECANTRNNNYGMDPAINEEWFGVVSNQAFCSLATTTPCNSDSDCPGGQTCSAITDPAARVNKTAYTEVGNSWLGEACDLDVSRNATTGDISIAFSPAAGNAIDHTLYYGLLSNVSTYTTTGSASVGATGSSTTVTLPGGSLFMLVAAENADLLEGCSGSNSAGAERSCLSGTCIAGWNCLCNN